MINFRDVLFIFKFIFIFEDLGRGSRLDKVSEGCVCVWGGDLSLNTYG